MKAIMPIAGLGSRFTTVGITQPKPLIQVGDKPMVRWAGDSIPFISDDNFVFIVRQAHIDRCQIDEQLREIFSSDIDVISIDYLTEGPASTARLAEKYVDDSESVIITDSDHYFENQQYSDFVQSSSDDADGMIPVFESTQGGLSYSKITDDGTVSQVKEKERISTYANIGAYYFDEFGDFCWALDRMESKGDVVNEEYYVAPTYNELLSAGKTVVAKECETVWSLGTPEDVERFEEEFLYV